MRKSAVWVRSRINNRPLNFWYNIPFILLQHFSEFTVNLLLTNQLVSYQYNSLSKLFIKKYIWEPTILEFILSVDLHKVRLTVKKAKTFRYLFFFTLFTIILQIRGHGWFCDHHLHQSVITQTFLTKCNNKNYNSLNCDWFKKLLISTNSLARFLLHSSISQSHSKL